MIFNLLYTVTYSHPETEKRSRALTIEFLQGNGARKITISQIEEAI